VVCVTLFAVLTGGGAKVCVAVAVAVAVAVITAALVALLPAVLAVCFAFARAFSGGTGTAAPGRVTVAWPEVAEPSEASDPACAGVELDFTALPIPKPAAIAITSNAPSSHLRRCMFPPSLRPVPLRIVVAVSTGEPVPCHPAR
jgi:hypothetical protein